MKKQKLVNPYFNQQNSIQNNKTKIQKIKNIKQNNKFYCKQTTGFIENKHQVFFCKHTTSFIVNKQQVLLKTNTKFYCKQTTSFIVNKQQVLL